MVPLLKMVPLKMVPKNGPLNWSRNDVREVMPSHRHRHHMYTYRGGGGMIGTYFDHSTCSLAKVMAFTSQKLSVTTKILLAEINSAIKSAKSIWYFSDGISEFTNKLSRGVAKKFQEGEEPD